MLAESDRTNLLAGAQNRSLILFRTSKSFDIYYDRGVGVFPRFENNNKKMGLDQPIFVNIRFD